MVSVLGRVGLFQRRSQPGQKAAHDHDAAAERHRRAAHGACAQRLAAGSAHALAADAGIRGAVDAGDRPRGHRHAGRRRAADARGRGADAARRRPRGARQSHLEMERRLRRTHPGPAQAARRKLRLAAHAVHARRHLHLRRPPHVLQVLCRRPDLPRQAARELGHVPADRRRRRRGVPRGRRRPLLDIHLSRHRFGRADRLCDHAAGDDARRHGHLRQPGRRPLSPPDRQEGPHPAQRPRDPDHRRRDPGEDGHGDRRGEGDPRARSQRLRLRPAAQAADDQHPQSRRHAQRAGRRIRRDWTATRPAT